MNMIHIFESKGKIGKCRFGVQKKEHFVLIINNTDRTSNNSSSLLYYVRFHETFHNTFLNNEFNTSLYSKSYIEVDTNYFYNDFRLIQCRSKFDTKFDPSSILSLGPKNHIFEV